MFNSTVTSYEPWPGAPRGFPATYSAISGLWACVWGGMRVQKKTFEVVQQIVQPATDLMRCRYVDLPEMAEHVGQAQARRIERTNGRIDDRRVGSDTAAVRGYHGLTLESGRLTVRLFDCSTVPKVAEGVRRCAKVFVASVVLPNGLSRGCSHQYGQPWYSGLGPTTGSLSRAEPR
eukprot:9445754-Pyramimonas_sp.AAC.1